MIRLKGRKITRNKEWDVRHVDSKRTIKLFESKKDAIYYASDIAKKDHRGRIIHKQDGKFKSFKNGYEIHINVKNIAPLIGPSIEEELISYPIVNNNEPIIQTITSV